MWDGVTSLLGGLSPFTLWPAHTEPLWQLLLKVRPSFPPSATMHFYFLFSFTSVVSIYPWTCQGEKYYTHHYPSNRDRSRKLAWCWRETELHTILFCLRRKSSEFIWTWISLFFASFLTVTCIRVPGFKGVCWNTYWAKEICQSLLTLYQLFLFRINDSFLRIQKLKLVSWHAWWLFMNTLLLTLHLI